MPWTLLIFFESSAEDNNITVIFGVANFNEHQKFYVSDEAVSAWLLEGPAVQGGPKDLVRLPNRCFWTRTDLYSSSLGGFSVPSSPNVPYRHVFFNDLHSSGLGEFSDQSWMWQTDGRTDEQEI